jgi:predicted outer membrane repeat protein
MKKRLAIFVSITVGSFCSFGATSGQAAIFNIPDGQSLTLGNAITTANTNGEDDVINLASNGLYLLNTQFVTGSAYGFESDSTHNVTINGNDATLRRSAGSFNILLLKSGSRVTLNRLTIQNGVQTGNAAGIENVGNLTLNNCTVSGNTGRGIYNEPGSMFTVNDSTIRGNTGTGFSNFAGGGTVNRSAISGNMAGGIFNRGTLTLTNSTVSGNSTTGNGGGILQMAIEGAPLFLVNTTIANNSATNNGGGLYSQSPASLSTVSTINSIIATNTAVTGPDVFVTGAAITSQGHNLIGKTDGSSGWIASDLTGTIAMPRNPMLAPLSGDSIHGLLAMSPALDAADDAVLGAPQNLTTDQRFVPRRVGAHVDIGAFEVEPAQTGLDPIVTTLQEHDDGICGIADCTLSEAVAFANANPDSTTITFGVGLNGAITTRTIPDGLSIITPTTIKGPGAGVLTISGAESSRIFGIDGTPSVISGLTFANGHVTVGSGGAIATSADLTVNNCRFHKNYASADGGAIYNVGPLTLNNCTFSNNVADGGFGGATHSFSDTFAHGNVTAINCTLSGNRAVGGGAVSNKASGRLGTTLLRNCTVSGNLASLNGTNTGGGAINQGTATHSRIRLENTIVAANTADDGSPDVAGAIVSGGYNLVGDGTGSTGLTNGANSDQVGTGGSPINPQLGPLQNNGGATDTRALLSNSPAINLANNANAPLEDQRYYLRSGAPDIGAFEFNGTLAPVSAVSRMTHGSNSFDINMPLVGNVGIECRSGGGTNDYLLVVNFPASVTATGAQVTTGTGTAFQLDNNAFGELIVHLTGVTNAQTIVTTLLAVNDGANTQNVTIPMGMLLGDTSGNGTVNATDVSQTKIRSGQSVDAITFRSDVTVSNSINASDVSLVKSKSGTALP